MPAEYEQIVIHCKKEYFNELVNLGLDPQFNDGEYDVVVDDVPYTIVDGIYQDPDEQLCEHYGIDYSQVNCIEATEISLWVKLI